MHTERDRWGKSGDHELAATRFASVAPKVIAISRISCDGCRPVVRFDNPSVSFRIVFFVV
jgi:hypothetical protein